MADIIRIEIDDTGGMDITCSGETITISTMQRIAICNAIIGTIPTINTIRDFFVSHSGEINEVL